jgi:nucleotide-binding universal stress UspA family protein
MTAEDGVVLVGVDGSPEGLAAVDWAAREAASIGCELLICQVVPGGPAAVPPVDMPFERLLARSERIVRVATRRARSAAAGLSIDTEVVSRALPSTALLDRSADARLLVVGSRGTGMFRGLLLGSTSCQVAAHAGCPVVVVHDGSSRVTPAAAAPVTVGLDWSGHDPVLAFAFDYAGRHHRPLVAVHAYRPTEPSARRPGCPTERSVLPRAAEELLADATTPWRDKYPAVPARELVARDAPAAALIRASVRSELVVVGARGHGGFAGLLLGSVSQHVLRHGRCAVAVVH